LLGLNRRIAMIETRETATLDSNVDSENNERGKETAETRAFPVLALFVLQGAHAFGSDFFVSRTHRFRLGQILFKNLYIPVASLRHLNSRRNTIQKGSR
jgi:hypothetical protein